VVIWQTHRRALGGLLCKTGVGPSLWSETGIKLVAKVSFEGAEKVLKTAVITNCAMLTTIGYRPGQKTTMTFDPTENQ
jgi:hypothetical protein